MAKNIDEQGELLVAHEVDVEAKVTAALDKDRKRRAGLATALVGYDEIIAKADVEGWSLDQAKAAAFDVAQGKISGLEKDLVAANEKLKVVADAGADPVEGIDTSAGEKTPAEKAAAGEDGDDPLIYEAAFDANIEAGDTVTPAHSKATAKFPKAKAAWVAATQNH